MKKVYRFAWNVFLPLLVGYVSSMLTNGTMDIYKTLNKPFDIPTIVFPIVWTTLYILMGLAKYLCDCKECNIWYYSQLAFNFFWSIIFFSFQLYWFGFIWLLIMLALIVVTTICFYRNSKISAYLMLPYILWVTFAGFLNLYIAMYN